MEITISELLEGARNAKGLTVIIDVFRAFSLECYLFSQNVERVIAVGDLRAAYCLKHEHPDALLIGERNGAPLPGFDCGNSPALVQKLDLASKTVIHTNGATFTFGAQKGGTPEILERLEKGMQNYRDVIIREFGINPDTWKGTGAAGGLGTALLFPRKNEIRHRCGIGFDPLRQLH